MNGAGLKNNGTGETRLLTAKQRRAYETLREFLATSDYQAGDQIASFQQLSEKLGMTVKMLQAVTPLFIADGILEVVPKVGTFLKSHPLTGNGSNQPATPSILDRRFGIAIIGKKKLRICVEEYNDYFAPVWRRMINAFEKEHPEARVEICLNQMDGNFLASGDVRFTEIKTAQAIKAERKFPFLDWMDDKFMSGGIFLPVVEDFLKVSKQRAICPAVVGTTVLYANRSLLEPAGLFKPEKWKTMSDVAETASSFPHIDSNSSVWGLAQHNLAPSVMFLGWGRNGALNKNADALRLFLRDIQFRPPPQFVISSDVEHLGGEVEWLLELMRREKTLFSLATMWYRAHLDLSKWTVFAPPANKDSYVRHGSMAISVRADSAEPELAAELARFITSPIGQDILGSAGGYLPVLQNVATKHPLMNIYKRSTAFGFCREDLILDWPSLTAYRKLDQILSDVRTGRIGIKEAADEIINNDKSFTNSWLEPNVNKTFCSINN